jgi:hypothetical protein
MFKKSLKGVKILVKNMIYFRPHHFLCSIGYEGKGYSDDFVKNYDQIVEKLRQPGGDEALLKVVVHTDDICSVCPHKRGLLCQTQKKIESLDKRHAEALSLVEGEILSWWDAKKRIKEKISLDIFHAICKGCQWKDLGICEKALAELSI